MTLNLDFKKEKENVYIIIILLTRKRNNRSSKENIFVKLMQINRTNISKT